MFSIFPSVCQPIDIGRVMRAIVDANTDFQPSVILGVGVETFSPCGRIVNRMTGP